MSATIARIATIQFRRGCHTAAATTLEVAVAVKRREGEMVDDSARGRDMKLETPTANRTFLATGDSLPDGSPKPQLVGVRDTARLLHISRQMVHKRIAKGTMRPPVFGRNGTHYLFRLREVLAVAAILQTTPKK